MLEIDDLDLEKITPFVSPLEQYIDRQYDDYELRGANYSLYMNKGSRRQMLDRFHINETANQFSLYDGHGYSSQTSDYIAQNLHKNIKSYKKFNKNYKEMIMQGFQKTEEELELHTFGHSESGSTALWVEIHDNQIVVAQLGDSQAFVLCKNETSFNISSIHAAQNQKERQRIEDAGGWILTVGSVPRIQGKLAVTRSFGDKSLKKFIISIPEISIYERKDNDDLLVIATDGLWNIVTIDEVENIYQKHPEVTNLSRKLFEFVRIKSKDNIKDNISIITLKLSSLRKSFNC